LSVIPTPGQVREAALRAVAQLTAIELGDADEQVSFEEIWPAEDVATVVTALLSLCRTFAGHAARCEAVEQIEIYRRTAAGIINGV
jgi:hypothetical protein